jgi:DNA-binding MarR family transcriptional regulator
VQAPPRGDLAAQLGTFLARIHKTSQEEWFAAVDELQISLSQLKALHALSDGELSISTLAERLRLSLAAASRAVDGLVTKGLLERRSCDEDRRARMVRLTPAGEAAVGMTHAARAEGLERYIDGLDESQRTALAAALDALA